MPWRTRCGGSISTASGKRERSRARVIAAVRSGSRTPITPCSPHAMPQWPIAVANTAKPLAVTPSIVREVVETTPPGSSPLLAFAPAVRDGQPAVTPEGLERDLRADRVLPPLVLGPIHHADHTVDRLGVEPGGDQILIATVALDVVVEDVVEQGVVGQRVGVQL